MRIAITVLVKQKVGFGPLGSIEKDTLLVPSTTYRTQEDDLVMIKLATMV